MRNSYNYWSIGAGISTLISAKVGHREQIGRKGFEYGVGMTPLVYVTELHAFESYLYYPNPNTRSQHYFGLGLKAGGFLEMKRCKFGYIAPGVILGKEYLSNKGNRRFFQVAMGMGALTTEGPKRFSSVSLSWGYGF